MFFLILSVSRYVIEIACSTFFLALLLHLMPVSIVPMLVSFLGNIPRDPVVAFSGGGLGFGGFVSHYIIFLLGM